MTLLLGVAVATVLTAMFALVHEAVVEADGIAALDHSALADGKTLRSPALDIIVTAYTHTSATPSACQSLPLPLS